MDTLKIINVLSPIGIRWMVVVVLRIRVGRGFKSLRGRVLVRTAVVSIQPKVFFVGDSTY